MHVAIVGRPALVSIFAVTRGSLTRGSLTRGSLNRGSLNRGPLQNLRLLEIDIGDKSAALVEEFTW